MRLAVPMAILIACAHVARAQVGAPDSAGSASLPIDESLGQTSQGHGAISIGFQDTLVNGFKVDSSITDHAGFGTDRLRAVQFDVDYFVTDKWSVHAGIPFSSNKYQGAEPHCPTSAPPQCAGQPALAPQRPDSVFLDDGNYHGTWQDWVLGVAYHTNVDTYFLTPGFTAYIPSHDYVHFAEAAAGQDIWRVEASLELAHQFEFSNLYYRVRYGYNYTEATHFTYLDERLSKRVNHHRVDLELGYFVNEKFSVRSFAIGKVGQGYTAMELEPLTQGFTNDVWFHHDQISVHDYAAAGFGADYHLNDRYTVSGSVQKLVWGTTIFDFKYSTEIRLTREF